MEFRDKKMARRTAEMLNGHPIGGKRRSAYYSDLWNLRYLPKFKWDNLTAGPSCDASAPAQLSLTQAVLYLSRRCVLLKLHVTPLKLSSRQAFCTTVYPRDLSQVTLPLRPKVVALVKLLKWWGGTGLRHPAARKRSSIRRH